MRPSYRPPAWGLFVLALMLPWVSGCSDETLNEPEIKDETFQSYVALGNSITAGFQSRGIVQSTQNSSYAALLAEQMGTPFGKPLLNPPGCPPPVENIFVSAFSSSSGPSCALRSSSLPSTLHNVAVPGATVLDALQNQGPGTNANALTQFILGGRTQVEAATEANPTFATVWLGNNDALGAALTGNTDLLTPEDAFETRITQVVESLTSAGANRGVLISVADPTVIPNLSPGQAFAVAEDRINQAGQAIAENSSRFDSWGGFNVDDSCSPGQDGASTRVPFSFFALRFGIALQEGIPVSLNCNPSSAAPQLLTPSEQATIRNRVQAFNDIISSLAEDKGWVFINMNPPLRNLYTANAGNADPSDDLVPKLPRPPTNFSDPSQNDPTFGRYFSEDGVHPSSTTHRVVAHVIIEALNEEYNTQLEQIDIPDEVDPLLP